MTFSKLFIIVASVAVSVSALAAPQVPLEADVRADAAAHTGDGTFYTRTYSSWYILFEQSNVFIL